MEKKGLIVLIVLALMLILFSAVFFISSSRGKTKQKDKVSYLGDTTAVSVDLEKISVTIYFISENDGLLYPEERDIFDDHQLDIRARQVIYELLKGSLNGLVTPFPEETKLRELYVTEEGTAYVDFTREIKENHLYGSSADISTVYCVVNSLTQNFEEIKKVFILIDGSEKETLGGHIDLSRPFVPRKDLIVR